MQLADRLSRWVSVVGYQRLRDSESAQEVSRPDGRRLRGVEVAPGIFLARDQKFYQRIEGTRTTRALTLDEVTQRVPLDAINQRFLLIERKFRPRR